MTHEGQGRSPDETPPPPVSTRWSGGEESIVETDGELMPPYLPGREPHAEAQAGEWEGAADATVEPAGVTPADPEAVGTREVATRLEELAARVRSEGYAAAERDMASKDRLTSLIAGVVAGYLAGLRE